MKCPGCDANLSPDEIGSRGQECRLCGSSIVDPAFRRILEETIGEIGPVDLTELRLILPCIDERARVTREALADAIVGLVRDTRIRGRLSKGNPRGMDRVVFETDPRFNPILSDMFAKFGEGPGI